MRNIFSGVKILDLSRVFSGPFATRHFADLGAEVIKIEPPQGDDTRNYPPLVGSWSGYFEILNRNKKSVFLNLKLNKDLEFFYSLCKTADVVVENFTPGITKNLKIDYTVVKKLNPKIIYASIVGISEGIKKKYYDVIAQAESGLASLNGKKEDMKISTSIVDAFSGMKSAFAISSALFSREITGKGMKITVSMKGSAFDLLEQNLIAASITGKNPKKVGNLDNAIAPFGIFKTKDGSLAMAIGNNTLWENLLGFLKKESQDIKENIYKNNNNRVKNIHKLKKEIEDIFQKYNTKDLNMILNKIDIPNGKVNTMKDVLSDSENYKEMLLKKIKIPKVGEAVVTTGGIIFK